MKRINLANRTPLEQVQEVVDILQQSPRHLDAEIASAVGISRRQVNNIRRITVDTPELLPKILSGELSVGQATLLRCGGNGEESRAPLEMQKLRADLRAWLVLTRELLSSIEGHSTYNVADKLTTNTQGITWIKLC
jgi:hypothetical protein